MQNARTPATCLGCWRRFLKDIRDDGSCLELQHWALTITYVFAAQRDRTSSEVPARVEGVLLENRRGWRVGLV